MKIKTTKKLNLPELIQHVWENDIAKKDFLSNEQLPSGKHVRVHVNPRRIDEFVRGAGISIDSGNMVVTPEYTFTVEVEEEVTQLTIFKNLAALMESGETINLKHVAIKSIDLSEVEALYAPSDSRLVCVWDEHGIPEHGVLEVDTE